MSAAFVRSTNIYLIHKIMQDCRRQFRQLWVFLRPTDELFNAVRVFLLLRDLLFQKLHLFRQFCLLLFVISRQLLKAAVIDLARNIVLLNPLEQSVKFLDPALRLHELSAFCGQLLFELFLTLGAEFFTEQVLAIGYVPKQDLQKFQHALFQSHCADEVCSAYIFALLTRGGTDEMILPLLKVLRGAVIQFFSAIGTVGNSGKQIALARFSRSALVAAKLLYPFKSFLVYNGLVRVTEDFPLLRWILNGLFDLVRLSVRFEVYSMSAIFHPFQNCRYCAAVPSMRVVW